MKLPLHSTTVIITEETKLVLKHGVSSLQKLTKLKLKICITVCDKIHLSLALHAAYFPLALLYYF